MTHVATFLQFKNYTTCDVAEIPEMSITGAASFVVAQNSPYRRLLKKR